MSENQDQSRGKSLGKTTASTDPTKQQVVVARNRKVQYKIVCAPLNGKFVTDSASYLTNTPYAIANAADGKVFYPKEGSKPSFAKLTGKYLSFTAIVSIPEDVEEVVLFLANDAYKKRRKTKLFKVKPAESGTTVVTLYETYSGDTRITNLKNGTKTAKSYPQAGHNQTSQSTDERSFVGYLTGDVWADFSYEYQTTDILRLCKASSLERIFAADAGRGIAPAINTGASGVPSADQRMAAFGMQLPTMAIDNTRVARPRIDFRGLAGQTNNGQGLSQDDIQQIVDPQSPAVPLKPGEKEKLEITPAQWVSILTSVFTSAPQGIVGARAEGGGSYHLPIVNIRFKYDIDAFQNAIKTSDNTTVQQIVRRTTPLAYRAVIEAAWQAGIDELTIKSTWRPMLGSNQHRLGIAFDVVYLDDLDDKLPAFKVDIGSRSKLAKGSLYKNFQDNLSASKDQKLLKDPWKNTDKYHKTHLHISAADPDAE